jgi:hypothetical protein
MDDFKKYLKKNRKPDPNAPREISLGCTVVAIDSGGNHHSKTPFLYTYFSEDTEKTILSFGGYCAYHLSDKNCGLIRSQEYRERIEKIGLCIDAMGRNHSGHGDVRISGKDMKKLFVLAEKHRTEIED